MPRVSVLLPVYNAERYLDAAIRSILQQTHSDVELIVLDDGSTDGSRKIARAAAAEDRRVVLVEAEHRGLVHALNAGIELAKGEYVARMDADDVSLPQRLALQVGFLDDHSDCCVVGTQAIRIDPDGWTIDLLRVPRHHHAIDAFHLRGCGGAIIHPSVMMRKTALQAAGGYRAEYEAAEDFDLFLRLAEVGKLANLDVPLLRYRLHCKCVTFTRMEAQIENTRKALEHAWTRRGRSEPLPPVHESRTAPSEEELMWSWTRAAFSARNYRTAQKHALCLLRQRPANWRRWVLFGGACLGPVSSRLKQLSGIRIGPQCT